jgi:predicted phage tail protein
MITTITLRGSLGRKFGRAFKLNVTTPREAIHALDRQKPGFKREILRLQGVDYKFYVDIGDKGKCVHPLELDMLHNGAPIELRPVAKGGVSAKGIGELILGIVLIAVSFYPGLQGLLLPGLALALGGISQLIAPAPGVDNQTNAKNKQSYQFSGPVNVALQGAALPLAYGKIWCGSVVGSSSIKTDSRKTGTNQPGTQPLPTEPDYGGYPDIPEPPTHSRP